jgi:hypothetical protein
MMHQNGCYSWGNKVIDNWYIPKLEFLQSVVSSIQANGVAIQWSADLTEHAHITEVKDPARSSNNQDYESQICRYLDRADKCRRFDLATAVHNAGVDFRAHITHESATGAPHYDIPKMVGLTNTIR